MSIDDEFKGAVLGDARLAARLEKLASSLAESPGASFPKALTPGDLEGAYRFFNNDRVSPDKILAPHIAASVARSTQAGTIIVAHDTTDLSYSTPRDGLGWIARGGNGVFLHTALALSAAGDREPLGILGLHTFVREGAPKRKSTPKHRKRTGATEATRWEELVDTCESTLAGAASAIHVMDREGDSYVRLVALAEKKRRFVIRMRADRLTTSGATIKTLLPELDGQLCRQVDLARRLDPELPRPNHRSRTERTARLVVSGGVFTLRRPNNVSPNQAAAVPVGVVHVREIDPPNDSEPVEWILLTTEPVDTAEQLAFVVDTYRARWVVEELFKALKTGCAIEKRQLESREALLNATAVFLPIAWSLLRLRHHARRDGDVPATAALSPLEIKLLKADRRAKMTDDSVRGALHAIARLGGHLKNNGEPGWAVLGRGYERLLTLLEGARLALELSGCDQS